MEITNCTFFFAVSEKSGGSVRGIRVVPCKLTGSLKHFSPDS
jgi:hypothetical protein